MFNLAPTLESLEKLKELFPIREHRISPAVEPVDEKTLKRVESFKRTMAIKKMWERKRASRRGPKKR